MLKKDLTKSLNSLLDEPIWPLHEAMIELVEKENNIKIPLERRSEEARGAKLVERKIRIEYMRPPHKIALLDPNRILGALQYMFDFSNEKYRNKMISLLYISRYFKQILTNKKVVCQQKK